jgi:hypothetical protein
MTTAIDDHTTTEPAPDGDDGRRLPARGRALWVGFGSVLLLAAVVWGTFTVIDVLAHEQHTESIVVPAAALTRLSVENDSGSVRIVGTDADEVSVEAEVSVGLRDTGFSHEVVDSTLELRGTCPLIGSMWCRVTYRIEMPRGLDVEVDTDNDRVDVRNVDGAVVVDSDNGRVELANVGGTVEVHGNNGRIVGRGLSSRVVDVSTNNGAIELEFVAAPDRLHANGDNGSIDIAVPQIDEGYSVIADSDNGDRAIDVDDNPDSPHVIAVETDNGGITVRYG